MTQIPLYYRTDLPEDKLEFKYCNGVPLKYLDSRYFITGHQTPDAYFGLFGPPFNVVFRDKLESDNMYYFTFMPSLTTVTDVINEIFIPASVLADIKSSKCKILCYNSYEGFEWSWWKTSIADPLIARYGISLDDFVFVCANVAKSPGMKTAYHNFWEYQIKFENIKWLIQEGCLSISQQTPRSKKFICLNRRPHAGRFAGVTLLYPYIDQGYLSMGINGDTVTDYFNYQEAIFQKTSPKIYKKYSKLHIKDQIPLKINDNINPEIDNPVKDWSTDKFYDSFLHICPETYQYYKPDRLFFSEKIFKPMMYMQPFVILGAPGSLKALHDMGYKTFSDIIDERYDDIIDDTKRVAAAIKSAVGFFNRPDSELHADMHKIKSILVHNIAMVDYRAAVMDSNLQDALYKHLHE